MNTEINTEKPLNLLPSGAIIMWNKNSTPEGWHLCNGLNNTPDLRDRFIVSVGTHYSLSATGGMAKVALKEEEMPSHAHSGSLYEWDRSFAGSDGEPKTLVNSSVPGRTSSHYINSDKVGSNIAHENRPPYFALCFIMKV